MHPGMNAFRVIKGVGGSLWVLMGTKGIFILLARADCVRYHGTKSPLLTAFFSLSEVVTFLPEGVIVGFQNFVWGFKSQNK